MTNQRPGCIILLNGASSAGKSTLCRALQAQIDEPFLQYSLDFFMFGHEVLPQRRHEGGAFAWQALRPKVFEGFFACLPALAGAGNNLVVDFIVETPQQLRRLVHHLALFDVYYVGVHCPLPELERRERQRGDRGIGDARRDLETVHSFSSYDFEIDSSRAPDLAAARIIAAWKVRTSPGVFAALAASGTDEG
ncbi:chloramphenicol phosphotransferase CPT family protein (plasmid) [Deinococcus sp. KNUC1210]|uniref:chloramphenicol phosphotransferase CPT family protein n=1 Tax=Deinococcus sp. KNUC1210 TaxID=2917691 RepID=UPI001EF11871|nr:chloramphenicol phosphotransferase CPT family protein [Deinococcus sp. KNUC1210]ULH14147.1 chloramphenicol phosphotransferase CPT family protein [Deinococcus sp. KNUC1210]